MVASPLRRTSTEAVRKVTSHVLRADVAREHPGRALALRLKELI